jgi:hypothetical protein
MPLYSFTVSRGRFSGPVTSDHSDSEVARTEALAMFADLARVIVTELKVDPEWQLEV